MNEKSHNPYAGVANLVVALEATLEERPGVIPKSSRQALMPSQVMKGLRKIAHHESNLIQKSGRPKKDSGEGLCMATTHSQEFSLTHSEQASAIRVPLGVRRTNSHHFETRDLSMYIEKATCMCIQTFVATVVSSSQQTLGQMRHDSNAGVYLRFIKVEAMEAILKPSFYLPRFSQRGRFLQATIMTSVMQLRPRGKDKLVVHGGVLVKELMPPSSMLLRWECLSETLVFWSKVLTTLVLDLHVFSPHRVELFLLLSRMNGFKFALLDYSPLILIFSYIPDAQAHTDPIMHPNWNEEALLLRPYRNHKQHTCYAYTLPGGSDLFEDRSGSSIRSGDHRVYLFSVSRSLNVQYPASSVALSSNRIFSPPDCTGDLSRSQLRLEVQVMDMGAQTLELNRVEGVGSMKSPRRS
ncbi:hypothetical protein VNO77_03315 [Canavalia gladiata]|uniref:Uncharacterized protein n=1 Tax=Canavalia gladiata TaxID=3824 RepID=A0AAN9R6S1_CANGL